MSDWESVGYALCIGLAIGTILFCVYDYFTTKGE